MKKILIDCRYLKMSGIGRVLEGYIDYLPTIASKYDLEFGFLGKQDVLKEFNIEKNIIIDTNNPVSRKGLSISSMVNQYDCFFTPSFIIPFGIKIPTFSMIHDLLFLDYRELTNGKIDYFIKKYFYKRCLKKSKHIFTVSNFTKDRIKANFPSYNKSITVVYNGLSKSLIEYKQQNDIETLVKEDYIVFVGNIKKHKGISTLIDAVKTTNVKLYLIGEKENFITSEKDVLNVDLPNICFTGRISDFELFSLISKAKFLVQPSIYEGFGLPPLEAMALGTKPIVSDIEVFKELYSKYDVIFFNVGSSDDLRNKIVGNLNNYELNAIDLSDFDYEKSIEIIVKKMI